MQASIADAAMPAYQVQQATWKCITNEKKTQKSGNRYVILQGNNHISMISWIEKHTLKWMILKLLPKNCK